MKKILIILIFNVFFDILCYPQEKPTHISGRILDSDTEFPLQDVNIQIKGTNSGTTSDSYGYYSIYIKKLPAILIFSYVGYKKQYLKIKYKQNKKINITLKPKSKALKGVSISANKIENIVKDKPLYIFDYDFYKNNIVLLAYQNRRISKTILVLINNSGSVICDLSVNGAKKLFKDCFNNIHLITKDTTYQIYFNSKKLCLLYPTQNKKFNKTMSPCITESNNKLYFKRYSHNNQELLYYFIDINTKKKKNLRYISNERSIELQDDLSNEIKLRKLFGIGYTEADKRFDEICFLSPVFAPLVKINDTIYIFNYIDSKIELYSPSGNLIKEIPISFHKSPNWKKKIYVDEKENKVYNLFQNNGASMLREINLKNGTLGKTIKIPGFYFIEKIQIRGAWVYFLYTEKWNMFKKYNNYKKLYKFKN